MLKTVDIQKINAIAKKAGEVVLEIYQQDFDVKFKADKSPLTKADEISNQIICSFLEKDYPQIPIISEENKNIPYEIRKNWEYCWMIDPLDGTKEFVKKNGEFTINIALIYKNTPIFGVVYAPVLDWLYYNDTDNAYKIEKNKIIKLPRKQDNDKFIIVASKSHLNKETQEFIKYFTIDHQLSTNDYEFLSIGSSLKLCLVAEGKANLYPRLAPTMEWDSAAADAIVRKSGKNVYKLNTINYQPSTNDYLVYNKKDLLNPWFVVV